MHIYTYVRIYIYVCLLCIEVHTYIYNYVYLLYPSVAPRFDRSPPVSVATSRQLPHPAEIDRASSRRSPSPAGNWPPGDHFTRKKCWENAGNMVISPSNNIDMGRLWFHQTIVGEVRFNWLNIRENGLLVPWEWTYEWISLIIYLRYGISRKSTNGIVRQEILWEIPASNGRCPMDI